MIQKITGLDPAGPCYSKETNDLRLSKTDATFVDVIHSDIRALGITDPIGKYLCIKLLSINLIVHQYMLLLFQVMQIFIRTVEAILLVV